LSNLVFPREQPDLPVFRRYEYDENDFCIVEGDCSAGSFVNLLENPEAFTGFAGMAAKKIWDAVYHENCFLDVPIPLNPLSSASIENQCYEKRVFFKVISGFHSSVSVHIADQFYNSTIGQWERNFDIFHERVGRYPERLQNMYLVYMLVLRAIEKLCPRLENYNFGLGDPFAEEETKVIQPINFRL
jgi:ERO1-like protein beta